MYIFVKWNPNYLRIKKKYIDTFTGASGDFNHSPTHPPPLSKLKKIPRRDIPMKRVNIRECNRIAYNLSLLFCTFEHIYCTTTYTSIGYTARSSQGFHQFNCAALCIPQLIPQECWISNSPSTISQYTVQHPETQFTHQC